MRRLIAILWKNCFLKRVNISGSFQLPIFIDRQKNKTTNNCRISDRNSTSSCVHGITNSHQDRVSQINMIAQVRH